MSILHVVLVVVLVCLLVGLLPIHGYSSHWGAGYWPSGLVGVLLLLLVILLVTGRI
jgi:Protein of unknown function (DUF3309)